MPAAAAELGADGQYTDYEEMLDKAGLDAVIIGTPYYAEGEYLHEIRQYCEKTPWRRKWQMGIDGITYITHSLGPILQWFPGERVTSMPSGGSVLV